jgi:hypothetical protein
MGTFSLTILDMGEVKCSEPKCDLMAINVHVRVKRFKAKIIRLCYNHYKELKDK